MNKSFEVNPFRIYDTFASEWLIHFHGATIYLPYQLPRSADGSRKRAEHSPVMNFWQLISIRISGFRFFFVYLRALAALQFSQTATRNNGERILEIWICEKHNGKVKMETKRGRGRQREVESDWVAWRFEMKNYFWHDMTCNPSRDTVKSVLLASFHEKSKSSHSRRSFSRQLFFVSHSLFFFASLFVVIASEQFVNVSRELIHMSGNVSSSHDTHVCSHGGIVHIAIVKLIWKT